jgi:hypothetical protein
MKKTTVNPEIQHEHPVSDTDGQGNRGCIDCTPLYAEELEPVIAPKLGANHNETFL